MTTKKQVLNLGKKVDVLTHAGLQGIRVPRVARSIEENILYV